MRDHPPIHPGKLVVHPKTRTNYSVDAVVGQPLAERSQSANFVVNSGFLPTSGDTTIWLPLIYR